MSEETKPFNNNRRRTNNPYTDELIDAFKLPKEENNPYKAIGDCLIVIPMEVLDDQMKSQIITLTPGTGATPSQNMRSRLLKGKVISAGEGVVGFEKFITPDRPQLGDIVYFEAHTMKKLPYGFGLIKYEFCLFVLDDDKEISKTIVESDTFHARKNDNGLAIGSLDNVGVDQKY